MIFGTDCVVQHLYQNKKTINNCVVSFQIVVKVFWQRIMHTKKGFALQNMSNNTFVNTNGNCAFYSYNGRRWCSDFHICNHLSGESSGNVNVRTTKLNHIDVICHRWRWVFFSLFLFILLQLNENNWPRINHWTCINTTEQRYGAWMVGRIWSLNDNYVDNSNRTKKTILRFVDLNYFFCYWCLFGRCNKWSNQCSKLLPRSLPVIVFSNSIKINSAHRHFMRILTKF